jgi:hypothetical protein
MLMQWNCEEVMLVTTKLNVSRKMRCSVTFGGNSYDIVTQLRPTSKPIELTIEFDIVGNRFQQMFRLWR